MNFEDQFKGDIRKALCHEIAKYQKLAGYDYGVDWDVVSFERESEETIISHMGDPILKMCKPRLNIADGVVRQSVDIKPLYKEFTR